MNLMWALDRSRILMHFHNVFSYQITILHLLSETFIYPASVPCLLLIVSLSLVIRKGEILIRNQSIFPKKTIAWGIVFPFCLPSFYYGRCVLIQVKGKLLKGLHCRPDPFQEVHFYTHLLTPITSSVSHFSLYRTCLQEPWRLSSYSEPLQFDYIMFPHSFVFTTLIVFLMVTALGGCEIFRRWVQVGTRPLFGLWFLLYSLCLLIHNDMNSLHRKWLPAWSEKLRHTFLLQNDWNPLKSGVKKSSLSYAV